LHITSCPPVVHLGADGFEAFARDAAGPALLVADEAALPQLAEDLGEQSSKVQCEPERASVCSVHCSRFEVFTW